MQVNPDGAGLAHVQLGGDPNVGCTGLPERLGGHDLPSQAAMAGTVGFLRDTRRCRQPPAFLFKLDKLRRGQLAGVHRNLTEEKIQEHENITIVTFLRVGRHKVRNHIA